MPITPPLSLNAHCIVVGGGCFGLSTALALVGRGYHVTVFDRLSIPAIDAASTDINKAVRSDYGRDILYQRLADRAILRWHEWNAEYAKLPNTASGRHLFYPHGVLHISRLPQGFPTYLADNVQSITSGGHGDALILFDSHEEVAARYPAFAGSQLHITKAYINMRAGWCDSSRAIAFAYGRAREAGVRFVVGGEKGTLERVWEEEKEGGGKKAVGIVTKDGEKHRADLVVMATGAWSGGVVPGLEGILKATGQAVIHLKIPEELMGKYGAGPMPVWNVDITTSGFYGFAANHDGILKIGKHGGGYLNPQGDAGAGVSLPRTVVDSPADTIPRDALVEFRAFLADVFPELAGLDVVKTRMCWCVLGGGEEVVWGCSFVMLIWDIAGPVAFYRYTDTFDGNFLICHHPQIEGLFVATGGSGHGMKFITVLGDEIADIIEGKVNEYAELWKWRMPLEVETVKKESARLVEGVKVLGESVMASAEDLKEGNTNTSLRTVAFCAHGHVRYGIITCIKHDPKADIPTIPPPRPTPFAQNPHMSDDIVFPLSVLSSTTGGGYGDNGSGAKLGSTAVGIAAFFAFGGIVISLGSIWYHLKNYRKPNLQRQVIRILWMVPIYGISSVISLVSLQTAFYVDTFRDIYEAFVIYAFFTLLLDRLGGERALLTMLHQRPPTHNVFPGNLWRREIFVGDPYTFLFVKRGILQFVYVKPVLAIFTMLLKATGNYNEGDISWTSGWAWLTFWYNLSVCLSLWCLVVFFYATKDDLRDFRPLPKFLSVKSVIFFSFWQSLIIALLVALGLIREYSHDRTLEPIRLASIIGIRCSHVLRTRFLLSHTASGESSEHLAVAIQDFLICLEMIPFAVAHSYAFSYEDYVNTTIHSARMQIFYAIRDSVGLKDVVQDTIDTLGGTRFNYRTFEPSEGVPYMGSSRTSRIMAGLRYSASGASKRWVEPAPRTRYYQPPSDYLHRPDDDDEDALEFDDPNPQDEVEAFYEASRKMMFGDYNFPIVDFRAPLARMGTTRFGYHGARSNTYGAVEEGTLRAAPQPTPTWSSGGSRAAKGKGKDGDRGVEARPGALVREGCVDVIVDTGRGNYKLNYHSSPSPTPVPRSGTVSPTPGAIPTPSSRTLDGYTLPTSSASSYDRRRVIHDEVQTQDDSDDDNGVPSPYDISKRTSAYADDVHVHAASPKSYGAGAETWSALGGARERTESRNEEWFVPAREEEERLLPGEEEGERAAWKGVFDV
ncbi:organic solute transporter Ostalpha-domain-containing protein [Jimgerdemannia flammicorona]|uniref:Organic solute transporter Ostalpha-domain-containing protein n=1 Tax=Jimgerdemannia flammicorona TaxID=994334 RepID=A0A433Q9W4_9FUNG|nr:organic solute transporter Ostalpha-domain-containing protein [Jimgerdemannia flammicorona]